MSIGNPLAESPATDPEDRALVLRAKSGDRAALEELVRRHQAWIYNIAVRMLYHPQDAEDATQEILVKALTALSSYEGRSSFRTWLYRIVVNHVLNPKRGRLEPRVSFGCYEDFDPDTAGSKFERENRLRNRAGGPMGIRQVTSWLGVDSGGVGLGA